MTDAQLADIEIRTLRASPGPWPVKRIRNLHPSGAGDGATHPAVRGFRVPRRLYEIAAAQVEADAEFMAQARNDVPALLAEVRHLRNKLEQCLEAVQRPVPPPVPRAFAEIRRLLEVEQARWLRGEPPAQPVEPRSAQAQSPADPVPPAPVQPAETAGVTA